MVKQKNLLDAPLFAADPAIQSQSAPLAERLRPRSLSDIVGQNHLVKDQGVLHRICAGEKPRSMIFWGPPGSGKTTAARIIAKTAQLPFEQISAIFSGVQDLRKVFDNAREKRLFGQSTILFVDEIHRFNRMQQDSFLPLMEDGTIILIGATTENPSFELNAAVLSRAKVLVFKRLDEAHIELLLSRAESDANRVLPLDQSARSVMIGMADGDGRTALNLAEDIFAAVSSDASPLDTQQLIEIVQKRAPLYDKNRDGHYDLISALHKSVRGSDPDAALYWFCRMLDGGELPLYIARRLVRMAVEDIGLADPQALVQANAAKDAYDFLGSPEGELALAQCVIYLASAPKSNAAYTAYKSAMRVAKEAGSLAPPKHILNAPTRLMREEGYGAGYIYDHDTKEGVSGQNYFPESLDKVQFYYPTAYGKEDQIKNRLDHWAKLRRKTP